MRSTWPDATTRAQTSPGGMTRSSMIGSIGVSPFSPLPRSAPELLLAPSHRRPWPPRPAGARPPQHRIGGLERVEDRALRGLTLDVELRLAVDARERPQMCREHDPDHDSVWTSTDTTDGRSRTMGAQLSPASADAYTCPPVVPKYTPHGSSESTAIASRNTLT